MLLAGMRGMAAESRELEADARAFRAVQAALAGHGATAPVMGAGLEPAIACGCSPRSRWPRRSNADPRAVQVLSAQRARARRFEVVFVLGLVEGEFPGIPDAPAS